MESLVNSRNEGFLRAEEGGVNKKKIYIYIYIYIYISAQKELVPPFVPLSLTFSSLRTPASTARMLSAYSGECGRCAWPDESRPRRRGRQAQCMCSLGQNLSGSQVIEKPRLSFHEGVEYF